MIDGINLFSDSLQTTATSSAALVIRHEKQQKVLSFPIYTVVSITVFCARFKKKTRMKYIFLLLSCYQMQSHSNACVEMLNGIFNLKITKRKQRDNMHIAPRHEICLPGVSS